MHKIKCIKSGNKAEYKEECEDQEQAHPRERTFWVYPVTDGNVCCNHCKRILRGKPLMERQGARILYHMENKV